MSLPSDRLRLVALVPFRDRDEDRRRVQALLRGGVTLVQLRRKDADAGEILAAARLLVDLCRPLGVPVLVNDRPDVARAAGADGTHVGPGDLPPSAARGILGPALALGVSARTPDRLEAAEAANADYVGAGALRASATKPAAPVLGFEGLADLIRRTALPVVAIGGVTPGDGSRLRDLGAAGMAVASGLWEAGDPEAAARAFRDGFSRRP